MAFALVNFYEEDVWDIIPSSDIILDDEERIVDNSIEGSKTLVQWKGKGKRAFTKAPAEIIKLSDDKDYLFTRLNDSDNSESGTRGKGCRKRTSNSKYMDDSADEEEKTKPRTEKRKSSHKDESAKRSAKLTKFIKEKYRQDSENCTSPADIDSHANEIGALKEKIQALTKENLRLREQSANSDDMKMSLKKLKKYLGRLEEPKPNEKCGLSTPRRPLSTLSQSSNFSLHKQSEPLRPYPSASLSTLSRPCSPRLNESKQLPESPSSSSISSMLDEIPSSPLDLQLESESGDRKERFEDNKISLGPGLKITSTIYKRMTPKKVGPYVANIMAATLSRECMATHSFKGQKAKSSQVKPKLDPTYTESLIKHALSVEYSDMPRKVIMEDVVKAIKYKLNNEEQAWKKQQGPANKTGSDTGSNGSDINPKGQ